MPSKTLAIYQFQSWAHAHNTGFRRRYFTQSFLPFLDSVRKCDGFRASLSICGNALEFVSEEFPIAFALLKSLVGDSKIELLSSLYSPALWVAFPRRDMYKNVEANIDCLESLGLPRSKVFVAPEGLFGVGLKCLDRYFDALVCSDEYLARHGVRKIDDVYRLGSMLVLVGRNHLSSDLSRVYRIDEGGGARGFHDYALAGGIRATGAGELAKMLPASSGGRWSWLHFGSGHAVTCPFGTSDRENFYHDREWIGVMAASWRDVLDRGGTFSSLAELASEYVDCTDVASFPSSSEGSWAPVQNRDIYAWMGRQSSRREDHAGALAAAWRSRSELLRAEEFVRISGLCSDPHVTAPLKEAWRLQLLAESCEHFGAKSIPVELANIRELSERAEGMAGEVRRGLDVGVLPSLADPFAFGSSLKVKSALPSSVRPPAFCEISAARGDVHWRAAGANVWVCEVSFAAIGPDCGVRFRRHKKGLAYCPTLCEDAPVVLSGVGGGLPHLFLPLSNGLIEIGDQLYLIRDNSTGMVAARVSREDDWLAFIVQGTHAGWRYRWRFLIAAVDLGSAVALACLVNSS